MAAAKGIIIKHMSEAKNPYTTLGKHLKFVREQSKQSLSEVSGAVEIDEAQLARIEAGEERPAEDVLLLLISYFDVQDREAVQLWELAHYGTDMPDDIRVDNQFTDKPMVMLLAVDVRTMYSDGMEVTVNDAGVTLNFTQAGGQTQPMPVARVGMSHQQAEAVIKAMQQAMLRSKYLGNRKLLPPSV